jgi:hypothetical protein
MFLHSQLARKEATGASEAGLLQACSERSFSSCSRTYGSLHLVKNIMVYDTLDFGAKFAAVLFRTLARSVHSAASCMLGKHGIAAGTQSTKCLV